jgi:putative hydrolase of the HAD superfamily
MTPFRFDPSVRAVFFDAAGTLIEPSAPVADTYAAAARKFGGDAESVEVWGRFRAAFRAEEEADRAAGWRTDAGREKARWRRIVAESLPGVTDFEGCFAELYAHFARPGAWRVCAGAGPLIGWLAGRGVAVGAASNFDDRLGPIMESHPELAPLAARLVVSSRVGWRKPARAFFDAVVGSAGCAAGEVVLVGDDWENDYVGATAAGLRAVMLDPRGIHPGAAGRVRNLSELLSGHETLSSP